MLTERRPLPEAVRRAVAASRIAATAYGSQPPYPDRAALERGLAGAAAEPFAA